MTKRAYPEDHGMPSAEALRAYGLTSAELEGIEILDKPPLTAPSDWMAPLPVHPEKPVTPERESAPWVGKARKKARRR